MVAMSKYKNISKFCTNCNLILSILILFLFCTFMSYSDSSNYAATENGKVFSSNNENIQDEYNYDYYMHSDNDSPSHTLATKKSSVHRIILNDTEDSFSINGELTKSISSDCTINLNLENTFIKYLIKQLTSQSNVPTERALRSDILLI